MAPNQNSVIKPVEAVQELHERLADINGKRGLLEPTNTWWFPYLIPGKPRHNISEVDETTHSIGNVLGMSDVRFDTLYRAAGRKWKYQYQ